MDAWIDCMSSLTEGHPLAEIRIVSDETLCVEISNFEKLVEMAPSVASELVACTAFVNRRYAEAGESARIALVPLGSET